MMANASHGCVAARTTDYARRPMPMRKTKRGAERTPLAGSYDVLICGASFAGLAVARELAGSGARVLVVDRYEIGERQTSACGAPTEWLEAMGTAGAIRQTFNELDFHTPYTDTVMKLPWSFSTFDYPELCALLWKQCEAEFETAKVEGLLNRPDSGKPIDAELSFEVATDRGPVRAPLVVDALGWRRVLGSEGYQPPDGPLSRGLEVHPRGSGDRMELWIERGVVPAGYGWSFPAGDELRIGVGSFDPRYHVKQPTVDLVSRLDLPAERYQGNWIPHRLRRATEDGIFFCGDSAGQCLPLTAEGIRTAFYFSIAAGRELRRVVEGRTDRAAALRSYSAFNERHRWKFGSMLLAQKLFPKLPPRLFAPTLRVMSTDAFVRWSFNHYLKIAPPSFARGPGSADDEPGSDQEQRDAEHAAEADRRLLEA
jgi:flavin-dependent dehydrogenase